MRGIASRPGLLLFLALSFSYPALGAPGGSDATASTNPEPQSTTTAWQSEPNGRGTFSLIFSCLATLTLCVWSALHLNVPAQHVGLRGRVLEKAKWVLYGIFAPELVVATAAAQFIVARWLKKEIEKDAKCRVEQAGESNNMSSHTWDITQCFYAVMGGFAADSPWVDFRSQSQGVGGDNVEEASLHKRVTITPEGIRLLSFLGRLPHIHEAQIEDKSKADWMAKSIICIQAGWMVIQVIGRAIKHVPVSLLEINTCGHVACAMAIYLLWWGKPLDIKEPTILNDEKDNDPLSLMYLCSSIGAVHGITDIRCFIHVATEEDELHRRLPSNDPPDDSKVIPETPSEGQITTYLSIGSPGSRNPSSFLGFDDLWSGEEDFVALPRASNRAFRYNFNLNSPPISKDCQVYYSPPYTDSPQPSLRHSRYCRRALQEFRSPTSSHTPQQPYIPLPHALLTSASKASDALRSECSPSSRPSYQPYYFTFVPSLGLFLGETDYIVPNRIPNFPSLHNLGLGQVNIHRDRLRSVLAITAAAYGALHCSGWPDTHTIFFPTPAERILWVVSSLTIAASGALLWGFYTARQFWPGFDRWVSGVTPGVHIESVRREKRLVIRAKKWTMYAVLVVFALARVYLVVEAFISLRSAPVGLYDTPEWTDFLPHL